MAAGPSLGQIFVGFMISSIGPRPALGLGGGLIMLFATALLLFARPLVNYGRGQTAQARA
jgi:hypothetical protein